MRNRTLDLVITDDQLALDVITTINCLRSSNHIIDSNMLFAYKLLRIRMKLAYEAARRRCSVLELLIDAIIKAKKDIGINDSR